MGNQSMRTEKVRARSSIALATLAALAVVPLASAQSPRAGSNAAGGLELEEVIVTARKREESLQDVPISVTALTAARIEELRITSPDDIARFTPGFSYVSSFARVGGERPTVRGQTNIIGAANASFFVDGVYISGASLATETSNLERIEVIKGPQAALYGRATFAGAINYITKRPTNEFTGKVSVSGAQHGEREVSGFASGPLIEDTLLYYVGARFWNFDGEYKNAFDGSDAGSQKTNSATVKLLWTPSEAFEATLLATKARDDDEGAALPVVLQGRQYNNCQLRVINGTAANNFAGSLLPRSPGYYCGTVLSGSSFQVNQRTDVLPDPGARRNDVRVALTTKTRFGGGYELTTVTGYNDEDTASQTDVSYDGYDAFANILGASQSGAFWGGDATEREDFAQEIRLDSPQEARLRWRLGAYFFKGNFDSIKNKKYLPRGSALTLGCVTLASGHIECPQSGIEPLTERVLENRAVFGDVEFDFTEKFTATAEVRYAKEQGEQLNEQAIITAALPACNPALPTNTPGVTIDACRFAGEWKATTPRLTFRYKATPDATYYLNAARGNKPGGFNTATVVQTGINTGVAIKPVYDEEVSKAYELGAKFNLFGRRATLNVAAFLTTLTGQQLTSGIVGVLNGAAVSISYIANIGETEIKGIELDGNLRITDAWDAAATFSYVDSKIVRFFDSNQVNLTSPSGAIRTTLTNPQLNPITL